jgi:hypothetical protein
MYDYGRVTFGRRTRRAPLASAGRVHRRDDGDRESSVRVDTVHDSTDASAARHAVSGADRVHALHPHGDLARALRRLAGRPCRRASGGVGGRSPGRDLVDRRRARRFPAGPLPLLRAGGRRRRRGLWRLHRDGAEVVPRSSRSRRRADGRCLRRRHSPHRAADSMDDPQPRLSLRVSHVGHRAGVVRHGDGAAPDAAAGVMAAGELALRDPGDARTVAAQLSTARDGADTAVLGHVPDDGPGGVRRPDGDRAAQADRAHVRPRSRRAGARHERALARAHPRSNPQRTHAAVLGLGVRPPRPLRHDGDRVLRRGRRDRRAPEPGPPSGVVRGTHGTGVLRVGRDLFPLPGRDRRRVRSGLCDDELWDPVHREGSGRDLCRLGRCAPRRDDGVVDPDLLGGCRLRRRRGGTRAVLAEAARAARVCARAGRGVAAAEAA